VAYKSEIHASTQDNKFGTDIYFIGVDNYASLSMTNSEQDFTGTTKAVDFQIKGIEGYLSIKRLALQNGDVQGRPQI
jgi:hypothetical protein